MIKPMKPYPSMKQTYQYEVADATNLLMHNCSVTSWIFGLAKKLVLNGLIWVSLIFVKLPIKFKISTLISAMSCIAVVIFFIQLKQGYLSK